MRKIVIIPAYNEEKSIEATVKEIIEKTSFDYVIINDCSKDGTGEICKNRGFNTINLPVNLGIGGAVQTGYKYADKNGYDIAVQVDGDGQHDPLFLNEMAKIIEMDEADMVIGSRYIAKEGFQSSFMRRIGIKYFYILIKCLTGTRITDPTSGLRMVNRDIIREFANSYPRDYPEPESTTSLICKGYRVKEIPVVMRCRQGGYHPKFVGFAKDNIVIKFIS